MDGEKDITNQKRVGVAILTSDRADFKLRTLSNIKKGIPSW